MRSSSDAQRLVMLWGSVAPNRNAQPVSLPAHDGFFATRPASPEDRKVPFITVAVSALIFVAAIPFATRPLAPVWAFIPCYQAALVVCDLVTAALLFGPARFSKSAAVLVLAAGYLFTACLAVTHALSFPGLFAPRGLLGAGAQSTAWLYMFWHAGFPLFVIAYAALKRAPQAWPRANPGSVLAASVVAVLCAAAALTWIATAGEGPLP